MQEQTNEKSKWELYQEIKDKMFQAKTREEWDKAVAEMKDLVNRYVDEQLTEKARSYYRQLRDKKEEYLKKNEDKAAKNQRKQYAGGTRQPMLRDDVQDELKGCLAAIAEYFKAKTNSLST